MAPSSLTIPSFPSLHPHSPLSPLPNFLSFPFPPLPLRKLVLEASKRQQNQQTAPPDKKRPKKPGKNRNTEKKVVHNEYGVEDRLVEVLPPPVAAVESVGPSPLPKPPAGFVLGEDGRVVSVSSKRIATIVDVTNNLPLECVIRRVFQSSQGKDCMLLCPVDIPVQILKSTNFSGWSAVTDAEVEAIIPTAAYALAKIHMHLVTSGFCYTARGGFCYSEEDIMEFHTDDGDYIEELPSEGVQVTSFNLDGAHYMIYMPSEPLLFVAVMDENGVLQIADDELLDDPAIADAIDEETEFNALVEEEEALLESS